MKHGNSSVCVCVYVCACVRVCVCMAACSATLLPSPRVRLSQMASALTHRLVLLIGCDAFRSAKISFDRSRRTCSSAPSMLRAHTASTAPSSLLRGIAQTLGTVSCCVRTYVCVCVSVCLSVCLSVSSRTVCEMKRRLNANSRLLLRAPR